jgi:hypothetical protein
MAQGQAANPNANLQYPKYGFTQKLGTVLSAPNIFQGLNNVYAQQLANAQLAQTLAGRKGLYKLGLGNDPTTGQVRNIPGLEMLSPEDVARILPSISNADFGTTQGVLNSGGLPTNYGIAPAAQVQQQGQQINARQGDVADYNAAKGVLPQSIQQGQQLGGVGFIQGPNGLASQLKPPAGMDDGSGNVIPGSGTGVVNGPMLAAGTNLQTYVPQTVSPFLQPGIKPSDLNTSLSTGVTNAQAQKTLGETSRHNQATEKNDALKAQADMLRAEKYQVYPPAGNQNPYTILNGQQNYQTGQLKAVEAQMKAEGFLDKKGNPVHVDTGNYHYELPGGLGGFKWSQGTDQKQVQRYNRFQQLNQQRQALLQQISGGLPFGGQAKQNLQQASNGKYGVQY